jgi:hypothetical protein
MNSQQAMALAIPKPADADIHPHRKVGRLEPAGWV